MNDLAEQAAHTAKAALEHDGHINIAAVAAFNEHGDMILHQPLPTRPDLHPGDSFTLTWEIRVPKTAP